MSSSTSWTSSATGIATMASLGVCRHWMQGRGCRHFRPFGDLVVRTCRLRHVRFIDAEDMVYHYQCHKWSRGDCFRPDCKKVHLHIEDMVSKLNPEDMETIMATDIGRIVTVTERGILAISPPLGPGEGASLPDTTARGEVAPTQVKRRGNIVVSEMTVNSFKAAVQNDILGLDDVNKKFELLDLITKSLDDFTAASRSKQYLFELRKWMEANCLPPHPKQMTDFEMDVKSECQGFPPTRRMEGPRWKTSTASASTAGEVNRRAQEHNKIHNVNASGSSSEESLQA